MTTKLTGCGSLILAAVLGFGCGGGGGTTTTVATFCDQLATKECASKAALNCGETAAVCKAARLTACTAWTSGVVAAFPVTRPFNAGGISACVNKVGTVYDKSPIVPADKADAQATCERVFSGSKKKNEACTNDYECTSGLICDPALLACAPKANLQVGDACGVVPGQFCNTGLYCTLPVGMTIKVCVARKAMGEMCDAATPCVETLRCSATTATCAKKADNGEACANDSDCLPAAPYCDTYFTPTTCDTGFIPSRTAPECTIFGATPGTGAGGAKGGAGGAAGGTSGGVGGAAGGTSGAVGGAAGGTSGAVGGAGGA